MLYKPSPSFQRPTGLFLASEEGASRITMCTCIFFLGINEIKQKIKIRWWYKSQVNISFPSDIKWSSRSLHLYFCYCYSHIHSQSNSHLSSLKSVCFDYDHRLEFSNILIWYNKTLLQEKSSWIKCVFLINNTVLQTPGSGNFWINIQMFILPLGINI